MTSLSRSEFNSFIESILPDNSSRQISASDLRNSFFNLADSIVNFNHDININSLNFGIESSRTTFAGEDSLARKGVNGFGTEDNSAYGYASLQLAFTGSRNTAIGSYALSCASLLSDNAALGVHSLGSTTVGSGNVGLGNFSLMGNKTGNFNIAIGHGAGYVAPSDSEFKFYLGAYPQASGDCDDLIDGIDKPPLLYGDLQSLQLGIGVSGFRGSEKLAVSGDILPYESGVGFSLGSGEYRWNAHVQDLYVSGNIFLGSETASFYEYKITDGLSAADVISDGETVAISGISGILTDYSSNIMRVSAAPLSGVIDSQLLRLSGVAPDFGGDSGLIWNVSGWAKQYSDGVGASAGAYTYWKVSDGTNNNNITAPPNSANTLIFGGISGIETNYRGDTNTLEISSHPLSGFIDFRFEQVSGKLNEISGVNGLVYNASGNLQAQIITNDTRASGLIATISGNLNYTIDASGAYLLAQMEAKDLAKQGYLEIRDDNISGWAESTINDYAYRSGVLVSGWAQSSFNHYDSRASGLIAETSGWNKHYTDAAVIASSAFTHWTISDGSTTENITATQTLEFEGSNGLSASYAAASNKMTISAGSLSGLIVLNDERASGLISHTSGVLNRHINLSSGNLQNYSEDLSGVLRSEVNDIINTEIGVIDVRIDSARATINSRIDTEINEIHSQAGLSGTLQSDIDSVSGYTEDLNSFYDTRASGYINSISGLMDYDFFNFDGIVHKVSGVMLRYIDQEIDDFSTDLIEGDTGKWKIGDQTLADTNPISFNSTLNIIGKDGLTTFLGGTTSPYSLTIDAAPLSGYLEDIALEITGVQGCFETKILAVSGWAKSTIEDYAYNSGVVVSGWAENSFISYDNRASGLIEHVSGILKNTIADSGAVISGWAQGSFVDYDSRASGLISSSGNYVNTRASGLIVLASGWNKTYTDQEIAALTLASDAYIKWRISDGTTARGITANEETQFLGTSGIETQTKTTGASGIVISARPLSGILHSIIDASGAAITTSYESFANTVAGSAKSQAISTASSYTDGQDVYYDLRASGLIATNDTRASGLITTNDARASGLITTNNTRASGLIVTNDTRASGLIDHVSGILSTSAGSGLVKLSSGQFNTAGSGNFERVILNRNGTHPSGQVVADSGSYHDIVNSSGYLVVPVYSEFEDLKTLNKIDPIVNSGAVAFAGGQVRVSNGLRWHRPPVIEGFMQDDLLPPTDYLNPTSGRIVTRNENFLASEVYYVTNRDHTFAASGGYYLMAMLVNNEYRPTWSTCSGCPAC